MSNIYLMRLWRLFIVIFLVFSAYLLLKMTWGYIFPFGMASIVAFFIHPLVSKAEKQLKLPRSLATMIVICLVIVFCMGSLFLIITEMVEGTLYLADKVPAYFQSFISIVDLLMNTKVIPLYEKFLSLFHSFTPSDQETIMNYLEQLSAYAATKGASLIQSFFIQIPALLTSIPSSATTAIFTLLATYFITKDWNFLKEKAYQIAPLPSLTQGIGIQFRNTIKSYLGAQFVLIFITGCIIYAGLLVLQIRHALTISLLIAFIDLLPILGTGLVFVPWIIFLFMTGNYSLTIGLSVVYIIVIIVRQLLEPKILTAGIGLNPLVGLFILFISLQTLGVVGFILTPFILILAAVLKKSGLINEMVQFIKG